MCNQLCWNEINCQNQTCWHLVSPWICMPIGMNINALILKFRCESVENIANCHTNYFKFDSNNFISIWSILILNSSLKFPKVKVSRISWKTKFPIVVLSVRSCNGKFCSLVIYIWVKGNSMSLQSAIPISKWSLFHRIALELS